MDGDEEFRREVREWLAAVEGLDARLALNRALEAVNYLVDLASISKLV